MSLSSFFATRRELKRLAADLKHYRGRAETLEKELKRTNDERYEREKLLIDRLLTAKVGTFAIKDEAAHSAKDEEEVERIENLERNLYLEKRKRELYADAREAGLSETEADERYKLLEPSYIESFQETFN